jgi:hypothetical protein
MRRVKICTYIIFGIRNRSGFGLDFTSKEIVKGLVSSGITNFILAHIETIMLDKCRDLTNGLGIIKVGTLSKGLRLEEMMDGIEFNN